jgi:hypothetical protein
MVKKKNIAIAFDGTPASCFVLSTALDEHCNRKAE